MGKIITIPFAAVLRWIYAFTQSYGVSIILFALLIKLVLLPFQMKGKKSMVRMGRMSKKQEELQRQYGKNKEKYQEELAKFYQEQGVNPMSGCLWNLLPLFIMLPLYSIIYRPITHFMGLSEDVLAQIKDLAVSLGFTSGQGNAAYEQIYLTNFMSKEWANFEGKFDGIINVDFSFLGLDLSATATDMFSGFTMSWACIGVLLIPFIAAGSQVISTKLMAKSNGQSAQQQQMRMMNTMMPLMSLFFCFMMPAAMGVYWIINTVLQTMQEVLLGKFFTKKIEAEEDERQAKIEADRKQRQEEAKRKAIERENDNKKREKKQQPKSGEKRSSTTEAGRVGDRPYARGRSYVADRYDNKE